MAEATKKKESRIKTWWTGVKAEFSRIIWPDKATIIRQTVGTLFILIQGMRIKLRLLLNRQLRIENCTIKY